MTKGIGASSFGFLSSFVIASFDVTLVPKLRLGNTLPQSSVSQSGDMKALAVGKLELRHEEGPAVGFRTSARYNEGKGALP